MNKKIQLIAILVATFIAVSNCYVHAQSCFGVLVNQGNTDYQIGVARQLGVQCIRTSRNFDNWRDDLKYNTLTKAGFKILLNVKYSAQGNMPRPYPADLKKYKDSLTEILSYYKLELVVIENEEENFRYYLATGKPQDSRLKMPQIIALRFAGDDEYVGLSKKAVEQNMSSKEIKMAIQHWKGDYNRL